MFDMNNFNDVREISVEDLDGVKALGENEYLLKVDDDYGFMATLTNKGELPEAFKSWRKSWNLAPPIQMYIIEEKYRRDWKFKGLRHGKSTAWVIIEHPYGFKLEINATSFGEIAEKITMVNGRMVTPCYFKAALKNAKLLVEKDDSQDFFYSLIKSVTDDTTLVNKLASIIEEERPDKLYSVLTTNRN
jgi:hypothetical protein